MTGSEHLILASRTASGKTEAAFLPVLSKVDFLSPGVKVLYISPLIALINDQFARVEDLCAYLDVPVTKWHGEANRTLKEKLIKDPGGVVLITPESLEAMLANSPANAKKLFAGLDYVIIDEIHSFIGSDRGIQLKSILSRLQNLNNAKFLVIGLSATIGDYAEAKRMTGDEINTKVLLDKTAKEMQAEIRYFEMQGNDLPAALLTDLYLSTKDSKVLIFPNSRGRSEEIAVKLKQISDRKKGHANYFSHHSSIDKELREYIEIFAKTNVRYPFAIACTSTLELGIDIGSVEKVVQVDATHSIASLIQRIGRSGRRDGELSKLLFYATDKWSLLQSLACLALYKINYIEPVFVCQQPYDILLHQLLGIVKQLSGCTIGELKKQIAGNYAFVNIDEAEVEEIINHLIQEDLLEGIGGELIIGVAGEWLVNSKDFYSVFKTEPNYKVLNYNKPIGEIPLSPQLVNDENILLAARIWKILDVDHKSKKIAVIPAYDGKKPIFSGSGADLHPKIRERMLQMLFETDVIPELNEKAAEVLRQLREEFKGYRIEDLEHDRPVLIKEGNLQLFSFQGTKVNKTLNTLFQLAGVECGYSENNSCLTFKGGVAELQHNKLLAEKVLENIEAHLEELAENRPELLSFSKWGIYLPLKFKCKLLKEKYFDFVGADLFLKELNAVEYTEENLPDNDTAADTIGNLQQNSSNAQ